MFFLFTTYRYEKEGLKALKEEENKQKVEKKA